MSSPNRKIVEEILTRGYKCRESGETGVCICDGTPACFEEQKKRAIILVLDQKDQAAREMVGRIIATVRSAYEDEKTSKYSLMFVAARAAANEMGEGE